MKERKTKVTFFVALVLLFVGFIGSWLAQTAGGRISVREISFETETGMTMSAILAVPDTATAETPAPAIVTVHGWYNNKEMQDLNYIEYARRGFVVLAIDQYSHGDSDSADVGFEAEDGNGAYEAVKMLSRINYVDSSRIGITGHSYGAEACKSVVRCDNAADTQLISAVLLVCADSQYTPSNPMTNTPRCAYDPYSDPEGFFNFWESRDVGIVAAQYDEFYHGYPADTAAGSTAPRDYIHQPTAQSFLYFGVDPAGLSEREAGTVYHQDVNGEDAMHVIFTPAITHPWAHFSARVVRDSVGFFNEALGSQTQLADSNQIWQIKVAFNTLSLICFFVILVTLTQLLSRTRAFSAVCTAEQDVPMDMPCTRGGRAWYWGGMVLAMLFGMVTYLKLHDPIQALYPNLYNSTLHGTSHWFSQFPTLFIGVWSAVCGVFLLLWMLLNYFAYGKKAGLDLRKRGFVLSGKALVQTIGLALLVVFAAYALVFLGDWLFLSDCRIWVITIRAFRADKLLVCLKYLPFFLIYFIAMSLSVNGFNDYRQGKKPWINTLIQCISVGLGPLLLIALQYLWFRSTGYMFTEQFHICGSIVGIWLVPLVVYLPVSALVCRRIYRWTNNPYLGGILMAVLITIINCTNTLTFA